MEGDRKTAMPLRDEFRLKEYEALLDKIAHTRSDVNRVETIYPLAMATIYAWTFTHPPAILSLWVVALWLPVVIALLAIVRLYSRHRGMSLLERYICEMEVEVYGEDSALGWERRYASERPLSGFVVARSVLALAILAGTLWVAVNAPSLFREWRQTEAAAAEA